MKKLALIFLFITSILRAQDTVPVINNGPPVIDTYGRIVYYIEPSTEVIGLLNFDGVDDYVAYSSLPSGMVAGEVDDGTFTFKAYINSSISNYHSYITFNNGTPSPKYTVIEIYNESGTPKLLVSYVEDEALTEGFDISSYTNTILSIEIGLDGSGVGLTTCTINGDALPNGSGTGTTTNPGTLTNNTMYVGRYNGFSGDVYNKGVYLWDLEYESTWSADGQPSGNTNAAWVDNTGSNNGIVYGSPTTINLP